MPRQRPSPPPDLPAAVTISPNLNENDEPERDDPTDLGDLEALTDATLTDVRWHIFRLPGPREELPRGLSREIGAFVCTKEGAIDLEQLRDELGGGFYRIVGRLPRGKRTGPRKGWIGPVAVQLDGAPKAAGVPQIVDSMLSRTGATAATAALGEQLAELSGQVHAILARLEAPRETPIEQLVKVLQVAREMTPAPASPISSFDSLVDVFRSGIEVGREAESGPNVVEVIRDALPVIAGAFGRGGVRTAAPQLVGVQPGPAPAPAASPPSGPATATGAPRTGFQVIAELISSALANQSEPAEIAQAAETVLPAQVLDQLSMTSGVSLATALAPYAAAYPVLRDARLPALLDQVIAELNRAEDDGTAG